MRCEFITDYKVRNVAGDVQEIRAGSVYFIHPDKAQYLLLSRIIRPVDYGDIQSLPYINEHGRLSCLCDKPEVSFDNGRDAEDVLQDVYALRDYADCIKAQLDDMAATGGGIPPEEIDKEAYRAFTSELKRYVTGKD